MRVIGLDPRHAKVLRGYGILLAMGGRNSLKIGSASRRSRAASWPTRTRWRQWSPTDGCASQALAHKRGRKPLSESAQQRREQPQGAVVAGAATPR